MTNAYVASRIVVPLDGSRVVRAALGPAAELAAACEGELILAIAVNQPFERAVVEFVRNERTTPAAAAESYLHQVESDVRGELDDVRIRQEIRTSDDPARTILEIAADVDATMIAMTSHGYTGFKKLLLGSVTQEVLSQSTRPVLLVPVNEALERS